MIISSRLVSVRRACALLVLAVGWPTFGLSAPNRNILEPTDFDRTVRIVFDGTSATVSGADAAGVTVTTGATPASIAISSKVAGVEYVLSGTASSGSFQLTSTYAAKVVLQGVGLTASDGPALSVLTSDRTYVVLADGTASTLTDSASYSRTGKGAVHTGGSLLVSGKGSLSVAASGGHGVYTGGDVRMFNGSITVTAAAKDAIHPSAYFQMEDGTLNLSATGDGIDAASGIVVNGGRISFATTVADVKGLKTDAACVIAGGVYTATIAGDQSKAISAETGVTISGGTLLLDLSGGVVLASATATDGTTYVDPSYCTGIKSDADVTISGGHIVITHTGQAGKGISADGSVTITSGILDLATYGNASATFTNELKVTDIAAADCLKADGNLIITGGTITARSTGTAGDAISCDGTATIGTLGVDATPVINVSTSGTRVLVSGSGNSADYSNPKAFAAEGNLTVNGGHFIATTKTEGGEGLESKANLVINGGTLEITTYDDGINAASSITINGGNIYCYASNNDGIDSNGTIKITGGVIVTSGTTAPEEGIDCDNNNFTITGGVLVATGGATSTPTASTSTQRSVIYRGTGTASTILQVRSSAGNNLVYKIPRSYGSGMVLLFSNPDLLSTTTYSIVSGVTVSGGTEFHGLYTGATVSGGTTLKTFTPTSMVTTVQ